MVIDCINYRNYRSRMRPDSEPDQTNSIHQSLGYWASLLSRTMEAEFSRRLAPHGLTRMSYAVLGAIVFDGMATPTDIADFLELDRGATTRLLDKLEKQGLIQRDRGKDDRRSVALKVSTRGSALARESQRHSRAVNAQFKDGLRPEEADQFVKLAQKMLAQADKRPEGL